MNRIDRVTAILIQLQSRKVVRAQDIAARFGISLRTVYRDISTLEEAGVPVIGEAGVGYSIMEGYRLPPVMFTREEALAFLTAEKLVEQFTDTGTGEEYRSAMFKVRSVLRGTEKDLLENIEEQIAVRRPYSPFGADAPTRALPTLLKSISDRKVLRIRYTAFHSGETTDRCIEPLGIFYTNGYWYTIAWCRLRNDYRDFRTDRIKEMQCTDEPYLQSHPSLKEYLDRKKKEQELETVVIEVERSTTRYLQENKYYYGFVSETPVKDRVRMTFLIYSIDAFVRWYAMFADRARIISPTSLRDHLQAHIGRINENL